MVGEHHPQSLRRALAERGEDHPLAGLGKASGMVGGGLEEVDAVGGPLGGEHPAELGAHVDDVPPLLALERAEMATGARRQRRVPLFRREIEGLRRQGPVMRPLLGLRAGVEGVGDEGPALVPRLPGQMVDADQDVGRQIVEESLEAVVEQRQPVLHAGSPTALAHRLVQGIVAGSAEGGQVAVPEAGDGRLVDQNLAHRRQIDALLGAGRSLGLAIEGADRLEGVAKEVEAQRLG